MRKGPADIRLGPSFVLASLSCWAVAVRVGMLCVPTLFDPAHPAVLDEQPPAADDEPGARE